MRPTTRLVGGPSPNVECGGKEETTNPACSINLGRFVLDARMHGPVLANHPSHWLPLCRHAPQEGGLDDGPPKSLLCLRLRNPVLDIRLLAVSGTNNEPHPRRPLPGRVPQRSCSAIHGQLGYSRYSLYDRIIVARLQENSVG